MNLQKPNQKNAHFVGDGVTFRYFRYSNTQLFKTTHSLHKPISKISKDRIYIFKYIYYISLIDSNIKGMGELNSPTPIHTPF